MGDYAPVEPRSLSISAMTASATWEVPTAVGTSQVADAVIAEIERDRGSTGA